MIFPLNFVVGAAVGAATTYVYKDEAARQWVNEKGSKLKGSLSFSKKKAIDEASPAPATQTDAVIEGDVVPVAEKNQNPQ